MGVRHGIRRQHVYREPWNKGKIVAQKAPFKLQDIWALRVRLQMEVRIHESLHLGTRQYARILGAWVDELGLDRADYGTHSMRRTKATPVDGFISLVVMVPGSPGVEVAWSDAKACLHRSLLWESRRPHSTLWYRGQVARCASARSRSATSSRAARPCSEPSTATVAILMTQLATSAVCLHFHKIEPRLARWLLMSHDRSPGDNFRMTQEFLAYMLACAVSASRRRRRVCSVAA